MYNFKKKFLLKKLINHHKMIYLFIISKEQNKAIFIQKEYALETNHFWEDLFFDCFFVIFENLIYKMNHSKLNHQLGKLINY